MCIYIYIYFFFKCEFYNNFTPFTPTVCFAITLPNWMYQCVSMSRTAKTVQQAVMMSLFLHAMRQGGLCFILTKRYPKLACPELQNHHVQQNRIKMNMICITFLVDSTPSAPSFSNMETSWIIPICKESLSSMHCKMAIWMLHGPKLSNIASGVTQMENIPPSCVHKSACQSCVAIDMGCPHDLRSLFHRFTVCLKVVTSWEVWADKASKFDSGVS